MIKSKCTYHIAFLFCTWLSLAGCEKPGSGGKMDFDWFSKEVNVDNWQLKLNVENQNRQKGADTMRLSDHYLKATLYLANAKTQKPLLYSISADAEEYEANYRFLAFDCRDDLYIKYKEEFIYPIGYVFEPSNGLSGSERLVYKFQIADDMYQKLKKDEAAVEYWYIERLAGLGKICFTHNN